MVTKERDELKEKDLQLQSVRVKVNFGKQLEQEFGSVENQYFVKIVENAVTIELPKRIFHAAFDYFRGVVHSLCF